MPAEGSDGAIRMCREIYRSDPDSYFYPDQYNNPANWKAHYEHTGPEIVRQSGGGLTHFVAAMAPAARSWASAAVCAASCRTCSASRRSPPAAFTAWKG